MPSLLRAGLLGFLLASQSTLYHRPVAHEPEKAEASAAPIVVPAGAIIPLELKNTVNSRTAYVEQPIYAETIFPVVVGERVLIPAHSYVRGQVTEVVRPGRVSGKAKLGLRCDLIILPDGTSRPLTARVAELGGERIEAAAAGPAGKDQGAGSDNAEDTMVEASSANQPSAIVDAGGVLDPSISGAAEGMGGLIMTLATRGRTIILRPGTTFELQLTQPLELPRPAEASRRAP
jgi:hypothetical protein